MHVHLCTWQRKKSKATRVSCIRGILTPWSRRLHSNGWKSTHIHERERERGGKVACLLSKAADYLRKQFSNLSHKTRYVCSVKRSLRGSKCLLHHTPGETERGEWMRVRESICYKYLQTTFTFKPGLGWQHLRIFGNIREFCLHANTCKW